MFPSPTVTVVSSPQSSPSPALFHHSFDTPSPSSHSYKPYDRRMTNTPSSSSQSQIFSSAGLDSHRTSTPEQKKSGTSAGSGSDQDRDAKLRNAAAQARHRQKRKAYVAQLEQSVLQLQERLKAAQVQGRSETEARMVQLQQENMRLNAELQHLRTQIASSNSSEDGYSPAISTAQISSWLAMQQAGGMYPGASSAQAPWTSASGHLMPPYAYSQGSSAVNDPSYADYDLPMPPGYENYGSSAAGSASQPDMNAMFGLAPLNNNQNNNGNNM